MKRGSRDAPDLSVKTGAIKWTIIKDPGQNLLAASATARGQYVIRWVGSPADAWYLFLDGKYLTCYRRLNKLNEVAHVHLRTGALPEAPV